ncbi:MAG: O-antigen ligase family protein [Thermoleophilia bacterium]
MNFTDSRTKFDALLPDNREDGLNMAALSALVVLVAGTLLFPDTLAEVGFHVGPLRISPLGILFVLTTPAVLLLIWRERSSLKLQVLDVTLLVAIAYITSRGLLAENTTSAKGLVIAYSGYVLVLYFGMAIVGRQTIAVRTVFFMFVGLGVLIAGYALIEFFITRNVLYGELTQASVPKLRRGYYRSGSTLAHPVYLGLFLVQVAPFFVFYFTQAVTRWKMIAWGAGIILIVLALEVTITKGAWATALLLSLVAIIWGWRKRTKRRSIFILSVCAILAVSLFTAFFVDTMSNGVFSKSRENESFVSRWNMWEKVPEAFYSQPLFGYGMWSGNTAVSRLLFPDRDYAEQKPDTIDNVYLKTLVEEGIVGIILGGVLLWLISKKVWRVVQRNDSASKMAIPVAFSISALLIDGITFDSLLVWPSMVCFWSLLGLIRAQGDAAPAGPNDVLPE